MRMKSQKCFPVSLLKRFPTSRAQIVLRAKELYRGVPILCRYCSEPLDREAVSETSAAWCYRCKAVFQRPVFVVPGWVAGCLMVLVVKLHFGI